MIEAGYTHRINYTFKDHPEVLGMYWDYHYRPIASVAHTVERMVNPEIAPRSLLDASERIFSLVYDNAFNMNLRHYGFHI